MDSLKKAKAGLYLSTQQFTGSGLEHAQATIPALQIKPKPQHSGKKSRQARTMIRFEYNSSGNELI
jgi:hypothetical protein